MLRQAVILAGGLGTRLGELTRKTPKPLLKVGGTVFIEHLLWNVARHGMKRVLLSVGYLADQFKEVLGSGAKYGVEIEYSSESAPAGTAGALLLAADRLDEKFLFLNGDTLFDLNYLDLDVLATNRAATVAMALRHVDDVSRYGAVELDGATVRRFAEKSRGGGRGLINAGAYVVKRSVLALIDRAPLSFEQEVLPKLAHAGEVVGLPCSGFFIDIGVPSALAEAQVSVPRWRQKSALFLDRDGVINVDTGYVHERDKLHWIPGAPEAIRAANRAGLLVIVATNQSGIGRGYYSEGQLREFMADMELRLAEVGAHFDGWYFCPHHINGSNSAYAVECGCRKPQPGMLYQAAKDWNLDLSRCVLIGDKSSDMEAARAAGVQGMLFSGRDRLDTFVQDVIERNFEARV